MPNHGRFLDDACLPRAMTPTRATSREHTAGICANLDRVSEVNTTCDLCLWNQRRTLRARLLDNNGFHWQRWFGFDSAPKANATQRGENAENETDETKDEDRVGEVVWIDWARKLPRMDCNCRPLCANAADTCHQHRGCGGIDLLRPCRRRGQHNPTRVCELFCHRVLHETHFDESQELGQ